MRVCVCVCVCVFVFGAIFHIMLLAGRLPPAVLSQMPATCDTSLTPPSKAAHEVMDEVWENMLIEMTRFMNQSLESEGESQVVSVCARCSASCCYCARDTLRAAIYAPIACIGKERNE